MLVFIPKKIHALNSTIVPESNQMVYNATFHCKFGGLKSTLVKLFFSLKRLILKYKFHIFSHLERFFKVRQGCEVVKVPMEQWKKHKKAEFAKKFL